MEKDDGFPKRLDEAMKRRAVSRTQLALACGVKGESIRQWLAGLTKPREGKLKKASDYLGVSTMWLREGMHPPMADMPDILKFDQSQVAELPLQDRHEIENFIEYIVWRAEHTTRPSHRIGQRVERRITSEGRVTNPVRQVRRKIG